MLYQHVTVYKHIKDETKWSSCCRQYFQIHFLYESCRFLFKLRWNCFPMINKVTKQRSILSQILGWRRPDDKSVSETMMTYLIKAYIRHSVLIGYYLTAFRKSAPKASVEAFTKHVFFNMSATLHDHCSFNRQVVDCPTRRVGIKATSIIGFNGLFAKLATAHRSHVCSSNIQ